MEQQYGTAMYPGVEKATLQFWTSVPKDLNEEQMLQQGTLLLDIGGGTYDHHDTDSTVARMVAQDLGIERFPELQKILKWAERDETKGQGTISKDNLDRAFGLSGLIMSLHRTYLKEPGKVFKFVLPLLAAHLAQEKRRYYDLPQEWSDAKQSGKAEIFKMKHAKNELKVIRIETSSVDIVGFLRNYKKTKADIVIQVLPSNHINIITKQDTKVDLKDIVAILRVEEARKKGLNPEKYSVKDLRETDRLKDIPEWFYDTAANTIQNGGVIPESTPATDLSAEEVVNAVFVGLDREVLEKNCPDNTCRGKDCYFYHYQLQRCAPRKKSLDQ